jgi:ribosomal protein S12 methylthiotransferase accessory factor
MSDKPLQLTRSVRFSTSATTTNLLVCDEFNSQILEGSIFVEMARLLLQNPTWEDLQATLSSRYSIEEMQQALVTLAQIGFACPVHNSADPLADAWWESIEALPTPARTVALHALTPIGLREIEEALKSFNLSVSAESSIRVVLTDDYLRPELSEINGQGHSWLLAKPCGHVLWIGPVFTPARSPCWECLAWWIRNHRWKQWAFHGWREGDYPPQPSIASVPATASIAAGMIAAATAILCATGQHLELTDSVISLDTRTLVQVRHAVRPVPGCSSCGGGQTNVPHRLHGFLSNITGVVSELEVSSEPLAGLFHAKGSFVHALPESRTAEIMRAGRAFGKGDTSDAAETACIAEAIERYSFAWRGNEPMIQAKLKDIEAIPPNDISQFSEFQLQNRLSLNGSKRTLFWIPDPVDRETPVGWVACRPLAAGDHRYCLAAAVFYAYPFETPEPYFVADSNGCAAGRSVEEALASALFELVERDALAIWWYNRLRRPAVRLDSLEYEATAKIIAGLEQRRRTVHVLDVTTDIGIPAYVAIAPNLDGSEVVFGAAAHLCPEKAVYKALSEAAQIVYWKDRVDPDPQLGHWLRTANAQLDEFQWLLPEGTIEPVHVRSAKAEECLSASAHKLANAGIASYWVNLTRPEIGVSVVRVIGPGLRHPWGRFAPGRLYDVPVRLGWLSEPRQESSLNPIYCML